MPYKSAKQQRFMHAAASRGQISKSKVAEFDQSTDFKDLPEGKVAKSKGKAPAKDKRDTPEGGFPFHNAVNDGGEDGSHEDSQASLKGARAHFHDTGPDEQRQYFKGKPR